MPFFASRWWYALLPLPVLGAALLSNRGIDPRQVVVIVGGTIGMYVGLWVLRAGARARTGPIEGGKRCQNGHLVPGYSRLCEHCGAPVPGVRD